MKHIVALSGGKDSTALAFWLKENEPRDYIWVCTPTGDELPDMIEHWLGLGRLLGSPILPVTTGKSLRGLIRDWRTLPNHRQRWCTRVLKIEAFYNYMGRLGPVISYVGLRADEEARKGMQFPEVSDITLRFPLKEIGWAESDVWNYLVEIPGHTKATMADDIPQRTDCARCYHQTLSEWWHLFKDYPQIFDEAIDDERYVADERGRDHTFRSPERDSWPADLAGLKMKFEAGFIPKGADQLSFEGMGGRKTMCRVCSL